MTTPLLCVQSLSLRIGDKTLCENLSFDVHAGQNWGLLGRNGAGKTTLLHSILGIQPLHAGSISLNGRAIQDIKRRELAQLVGMLFQEGVSVLPATVLETVMLGRHPHARSLLGDNEDDRHIAEQALALFDLQDFAQRDIDSLSGGERQRLALAMLICQQPRLYLLDEPSNHLDVAFQSRMLEILGDKARKENACQLMATHDINLAARFCDAIVLLLPDGKHLTGTKDEVLTEANLSRAFECPIARLHRGDLALYYPDTNSGS